MNIKNVSRGLHLSAARSCPDRSRFRQEALDVFGDDIGLEVYGVAEKSEDSRSLFHIPIQKIRNERV
jgi:hypothetical protein